MAWVDDSAGLQPSFCQMIYFDINTELGEN